MERENAAGERRSSSLTVQTPRGVSRHFDAVALVDEWRQHMQELVGAGERSPATVRTYLRGMTRFLAWFDGQGAYANVGPRALRAWKADLLDSGYAPNTVNTHYAGVRDFFRWATAQRGIAYDPTANVSGAVRRQSRRHKREALTDQEIRRVLAQPDPSTDIGRRDRALLMLMAYTGVRTIEVQRARLGDLQTTHQGGPDAEGAIRLWVHGKGHVEADEYVYLVHRRLLGAFYDWLAVHPRGDDLEAAIFCGLGNRNMGGPLAAVTIRVLVKKYYRKAGIRDPRKTTHSLRHSLVTNLIRHKVPPTKIMTVTRHKSLDTLLAYAHEMERDEDPAEGYVDYGE